MLRPIDIQNKEFEKKIKGYDCDEVDDFLDLIIQDYEKLCKENQTLKDRIGVLTNAVERYQNIEDTMKKTLEIAKENADELRKNAELEAQMIVSKAKLDATRLSKQIDDEHVKKHQEMLALKTEIDSYRTRIAAVCSALMKTVEDIK